MFGKTDWGGERRKEKERKEKRRKIKGGKKTAQE